MKFEIVSDYADDNINPPIRKTKYSAGYDFEVAEDTAIPSVWTMMDELRLTKSKSPFNNQEILSLHDTATLTKARCIRPTLVPTGIKCEMPNDMYLELSVRSSCPLKHWLVLANGVGIIDADYYNNPDNEGHIYFQLINLAPFEIMLRKGDVIGQGIFHKYYITDDDTAITERQGGFGSTDTIETILTADEWYQLGINLFQPVEECVFACNPERRAFVVDSPKTFTTENHDVEYLGS